MADGRCQCDVIAEKFRRDIKRNRWRDKEIPEADAYWQGQRDLEFAPLRMAGFGPETLF